MDKIKDDPRPDEIVDLEVLFLGLSLCDEFPKSEWERSNHNLWKSLRVRQKLDEIVAAEVLLIGLSLCNKLRVA